MKLNFSETTLRKQFILIVYRQCHNSFGFNAKILRLRYELPPEKLSKFGAIHNNSIMQKNQRNTSFMKAWKEAIIAIEYARKFQYKWKFDLQPPSPDVSDTIKTSSTTAHKNIYLTNGLKHTIHLDIGPGESKITVIGVGPGQKHD